MSCFGATSRPGPLLPPAVEPPCEEARGALLVARPEAARSPVAGGPVAWTRGRTWPLEEETLPVLGPRPEPPGRQARMRSRMKTGKRLAYIGGGPAAHDGGALATNLPSLPQQKLGNV